jgi:hypothetical protein
MSLVDAYNASDEDRRKEEGGRKEPSSIFVHVRLNAQALFSSFKGAST